jgi:anti-anti-sigma factor
MTVESRLSEDGKLLVISIDGAFDFVLLNDFRQAYCDNTISPEKFIVDMRKTSTIDSSALGMLLNMKRQLNKPDGDIRIINCNDVVKKVFRITSFDKKFIIE